MKDFLERQFSNYVLWAPFIMAGGIALYFALPAEPGIPLPFIFAGLCIAGFIANLCYRAKLNFRVFTIIASAMLFGFGFFYSCGFTNATNTPLISSDIRAATIVGKVSAVDYLPGKSRILIKSAQIKNDYAPSRGYMPMTVRLSANDEIDVPTVGATITVQGALFRPAPADVPGGFDFAEWSYFKGISATGYITQTTNVETPENIGTNIARIRDALHLKIAHDDNFHSRMLADSLILGYNNAIPPDENDSIKASGISHIFSISGYHMTMIGGWLFAFFFLIAKLIAPLSRRYPVRNIAIIPTAICLCFYLMLSGAGVATQRAFVMALIGFVALMFNRNLFSLRSASIVFGALLLFNPHNLMTAGFQLSFAAIFGILYFFSNKHYQQNTKFQKFIAAAKGIFMSSLVATIFTMPFIAYHFNAVQLYSVLGNILCIPIFSILIMPLTLVGTITAQFGFFAPLDLAAQVYEIVLMITNWIANLPAATVTNPFVPGYALAVMVLGFLCFMFINGKRAKHFLTGLFVLASLFMVGLRPRPVFYVSHDHELAAFMTDDGTLQFSRGKSSAHKMTFDTWEKFNNQTPRIARKSIRYGFNGGKYMTTCGGGLCLYKTPEFNLAYSTKFVSLVNNFDTVCHDNDFIVSKLKITAPNCGAKILDRGLIIYKDGTVKNVSSDRRWHQ